MKATRGHALKFLAGLLMSGCGPREAAPEVAAGAPRAEVRRIAPVEARRKMAEPGTVVLDVRSAREFAAGHIPGARLVPHAEIERRAPAELPDREAPILVYCRSGSRSAYAARRLVELGYANVYDLGGLNRWDGPLVR